MIPSVAQISVTDLFITGYIMTSGEMTVPADILQHIKTLSRLECVQVNVVPQRDETLCQLDIDDADYSVYLDLSVCYINHPAYTGSDSLSEVL